MAAMCIQLRLKILKQYLYIDSTGVFYPITIQLYKNYYTNFLNPDLNSLQDPDYSPTISLIIEMLYPFK